MQGLPVAITGACRRDTAPGLAAAIVRMHCDEAVNASCVQTGLRYIDAFYNEARVNALIGELAQPALDRFRARAKSKAAVCDVLHFTPGPRLAEGTVATLPESRERRVTFN